MRKRVRALEAITPPPTYPPPPAQPNYGPRYIQWSPTLSLDGAGTPPNFSNRVGFGMATFEGAAGLWFVHTTIQISQMTVLGTSGVDWLLSLHPSYPRVGVYVPGDPDQQWLGYGQMFHDPLNPTRVYSHPRLQPPASGGLTTVRMMTEGNVAAKAPSTPFAWNTTTFDGMQLTADYWSPGP